MKNCRPVSILSFFPNILEKLKFNGLNFFVEKYNILTNVQDGFRVGKLTAAACKSSIGSTLEVLDNHLNAVGIFLHLAEACDVLNHKILFKKLEIYNFQVVHPRCVCQIIQYVFIVFTTSYINIISTFVRTIY